MKRCVMLMLLCVFAVSSAVEAADKIIYIKPFSIVEGIKFISPEKRDALNLYHGFF